MEPRNEIINQIREINPAVNTLIGANNGISELTLEIAKAYDLNHFTLGTPVSEISPIERTYRSWSWDANRVLMVVGSVEPINLLNIVRIIRKELHIKIPAVMSVRDGAFEIIYSENLRSRK